MTSSAFQPAICVMNWNRIINNFELVFKRSYSGDKKAHFDNLPDEFKVVDGAKGTWSQLILLDAMIYILENDSFNSSSRRAFNQHKVLCECILDELEMIYSMAHFEIMEWKLSSASKGNKYSSTNPETMSKELMNKYSHMITHGALQYPWNSLDSMRTALIEGPASKAKNKFSTVTELLMNHDSLAHFGFDLDLIVQCVIHRVLFVFKNHKNALAPLMSRSGKTKRVEHHVRADESPDRLNKVQKTVAIPLSSTSTPLLSSSVLLSIMNKYKPSAVPVVTTSIPAQLAATLIPEPLLDDLAGLSDGDFDFFSDFFEGDGVAHGVVPVVILQTDPEHLCAIIPVLPMELLSPELIDTVSNILEDDEGHFLDADTFDMLNSLAHSPRSPRSPRPPFIAPVVARSRSFSEEEEGSAAEDGCKSDSMSSLSSCSTPVSTSLREREREREGQQSVPEGEVVMTFNPTTTKYILQDNVLCALVPVSDPKVIAAHHAAAAVQKQHHHQQHQHHQQNHHQHQQSQHFCGFNSLLPTIAEHSLSSSSSRREDSVFIVEDGNSSVSTTFETQTITTTNLHPINTTTNNISSSFHDAQRRRSLDSLASTSSSTASSQQENDAHMTNKTNGDLVTHIELTNTCLESLISGECFNFE